VTAADQVIAPARRRPSRGRDARPSSPLNESERAILAQIMSAPATLRSELSERLGLSKATISAGMKRLLAAGLVTEHGGAHGGGLGRPAGVYRVSDQAGCCVAIDMGTTRVWLRVIALDGRILAELAETIRPSYAQFSQTRLAATVRLIEQAGTVLNELGTRMRGCIVAAPMKVSRDEPEPPQLADAFTAIRALPRTPDAALAVENNVNCAAIAEGEQGVAQGEATFAYLQVGVKVGLGFVHEGRLLRGRGGAGEVACLPYPWGAGARPSHLALEHHLGSAGLLARARARTDIPTPRGTDVAALFQRAAEGEPGPRELVDEHAREIGETAAAIVALLDPGLIVLGGGVGSNPILLRGVRQEVRRLAWETRLENGRLGSDATMIGAARLAAETARRDVLAGSYAA
jgi:predicted NBD/HSP70 family sugar kinase